MRFIEIFILLIPLIASGQRKLDGVRISKESCGGSTASIAYCINSQRFDSDRFMHKEDVELLNSILTNSKYKKHFQAKIGQVNCAEFTFDTTKSRVAIICNDGICKLIDFTNLKEWSVNDPTYQVQLKALLRKYWL